MKLTNLIFVHINVRIFDDCLQSVCYCEVSRFWHSTVTGGDGAVRYNLWAGFHLANCREIQKIWINAWNTSVGLWHCENGVPSVPVVPAGSLRHQSHSLVQQRDAVLRVRINFTAQLICTNYNARCELHSIMRRFSICARLWGRPILIEVKMILKPHEMAAIWTIKLFL